METVKFGKTGMQVSKVCLGCMTYGSTKWREWVLEEEASRPFIREALEKGINFFDTADVYSQGASEEIVGRALKEYAKRPEVVIATKVHGAMGPGANAKGLSRKHIMEAIDASLRRLGTDYVDLYQIHRFDPLTPMEETLEALNDVVRAGKALYIGASSMYALAVRAHARHRPRQGPRRIRVDAELLQPRLSRGGARDDAALRQRWDRGHPVVADGARLSRRLGRRRGRFHGARPHRSVQRHARPGIAAGRGDPQAGRRDGGKARTRSRRWSRSPGCCRSLSSPPRSSAPRSPITSPTPSRRRSSSSTPAPSPGSRSPITASRSSDTHRLFSPRAGRRWTAKPDG